MPKVEIMKSGMVFDVLSSQWDALYQASPLGTPFQSRTWIQTWAKHFSADRNLQTIVVHEGNDLVALYPLVAGFAPWMPLRPAGVGPSDYLQPLTISDDESLMGTVVDVLHELSKKHLLDLHQLPGDHPFLAGLRECRSVSQATCLVLDLPNSYEDYVAGLSKSLRYDVRRLEGKALKERNATVEWMSAEQADEFADQFFALHRLRWKSRGLPGAFFGKGERFQRDWMRQAVQDGTVIMNRLVAEGKPVGCVYAMRSGHTTYFYQAGMDPDASSLSPGTILVSKMIQRAIEDGYTTFDFMRGDEPYKRRWKPNRERVNSRILIPSQNVLGKAGIWWNDTAWRVELKVRQRLEGKSLRKAKAPSSSS